MIDDRPTWPPPEHAQRVLKELVELLEPHAAGREGNHDVVSRVKRLLEEKCRIEALAVEVQSDLDKSSRTAMALARRVEQADADREALHSALKPIANQARAAFEANHAPPHCALGLKLKVADGEAALAAYDAVKPSTAHRAKVLEDAALFVEWLASPNLTPLMRDTLHAAARGIRALKDRS